jgi:hypothetical protein
MNSSGLGQLIASALQWSPPLFAALVLFFSLPVYALGWIFGKVSEQGTGGSRKRKQGWNATWSRLGPWLAVFVGLLTLVFLILLATAVTTALASGRNPIAFNQVSGEWRWLFYLPPVVIVLVVGMIISAVGMWMGDLRSLAGRIFYTVLTLLGVSIAFSLFSLGMVGQWN